MSPEQRMGRMISELVRGAWRPLPPPLACSESEFTALAPLLSGAGIEYLVWHRLRGTSLHDTRWAKDVRRQLSTVVVQTLRREQALRVITSHLRAQGIEPIVVKGWSIARLYPDTMLRPYGDHDLLVPPESAGAAEVALRQIEDGQLVDLKGSPHELYPRAPSFAELYARSVEVDCDGTPIRIPSPEDQLRHLCFHFLKHGVQRPQWLCDIAILMEHCLANFDWDRFYLGDARLDGWLAGTLSLAHELLDAPVAHVPFPPGWHAPKWLAHSVLHQWGMEFMHRPWVLERIRRQAWQPRGWWNEIRQGWPHAVVSLYRTGAPVHSRVLWPYQLRYAGRKTAELIVARRRRTAQNRER